jgi:hypothetical protein
MESIDDVDGNYNEDISEEKLSSSRLKLVEAQVKDLECGDSAEIGFGDNSPNTNNMFLLEEILGDSLSEVNI